MRDPGVSRPNPLFAPETVEDDPDEPNVSASSSLDDWARLDELLPSSGSAAEAVIGAMLEAGPEAVEHLVNAGQELLLAAKTMLDAAERGLEEHRRSEADRTEPADAATQDPSANVTHLDLG